MTTPLLGWVTPAPENSHWYEDFIGLVEAIEASVYAGVEDRNLIIHGGGDIAFDAGTGAVSWSSTLYCDGFGTGYRVTIAAGSRILADGQSLVVDLVRAPSADTAASTAVRTSLGAAKSAQVRLCKRVGARLYWRFGSVQPAGTTTIAAMGAGGAGLSDDVVDALDAADAPAADNALMTASAVDAAIAAAGAGAGATYHTVSGALAVDAGQTGQKTILAWSTAARVMYLRFSSSNGEGEKCRRVTFRVYRDRTFTADDFVAEYVDLDMAADQRLREDRVGFWLDVTDGHAELHVEIVNNSVSDTFNIHAIGLW